MYKLVIVILAIFTNVTAQLCLRKGMMNIPLSRISSKVIQEVVSSKFVWLGLILYVFSFTLYLYVLSKFEVSFINPIIMGAGFILILTFSVLFLNESFSLNKILGIILISVGIFVISIKKLY
jgi:multidrug transporter EmrE-like cation transporter